MCLSQGIRWRETALVQFPLPSPPQIPQRTVTFRAVADLRGDVPHFCRMGGFFYWHTEPKQVKRHRDTHVSDRYGWLCPNWTGTCPSLGGNFRRRDAVHAHCRRSLACASVLGQRRPRSCAVGLLPMRRTWCPTIRRTTSLLIPRFRQRVGPSLRGRALVTTEARPGRGDPRQRDG